jgi:cation:H+ antiporter
MLESIVAVIAGFLLLAWGADRMVLGASATARNFGVSPMIIGLTIVGFGTSAPEMLVSGVAAWEGNTGLSIGNALGSNITNIALVLGVTALVVPLSVHSDTVRREIPILLAVSLLAYILVSDGVLGQLDGLLLLAGLVLMIVMVVSLGKKSAASDPLEGEFAGEMPAVMSTGKALFWLLLGIVVLLIASRLLVWGAVNIAHSFGVSDLVIGLTIVAIGTSMPELMASVMSALKNEHDIAIGNVIGSNMFNLLGVLSLPGLISPGGFLPEVLARDFPWMIGLTLAFFVMAYGFRGHGKLNRIEGAILVAAFCGYMVTLYFSATA